MIKLHYSLRFACHDLQNANLTYLAPLNIVLISLKGDKS